MSEWTAVGALALVAVAIPASMIGVSWLLRPSVPEQGKRATYESGEVPTGSSRQLRFNIQYYMVALLFLVFDVETIFIIPWTVVFEDAVVEIGLLRTFAPMAVFLGLLVLGLGWAWRNGAVEWVKSNTAQQQRTDRTEL
jgi:NADH-quinone oxidoreductase subunit A